MTRPEDITVLIDAHCAGDPDALERMLPMVYDELHRIAGRAFAAQHAGHTLQPTALVHEVWMKLAKGVRPVADRRHFFAVAAKAMRQVLTNHAKAARARKRGDGRRAVTLHELQHEGGEDQVDVIALDDALQRLSELNERHARIVELRFLGGLTIPETAEALEVSHGTVERDWAMARAWLGRELRAF